MSAPLSAESADFDLIRALLRKLVTILEIESDGLTKILMEEVTLSPPASLVRQPGDREKILPYIDLLVTCGLIKRTIKLKLRHHPDIATLEPNEQTRLWAQYAQEDAEWARRRGELKRLLAKHRQNSQ